MTHQPLTGSQLLISLLILLVIASLTSYYADKKGRNSTAWFVLTLLFGPLVSIVLLFLPSLNKSQGDLQQRPPKNPINNLENYSKTSLASLNSQSSSEDQASQQLSFLKEDKLWYYLDEEHQQYGPISLIGLKELWNTGRVRLATYVWSEGMDKWKKIEELPDLHQALVAMKNML
jgi:hypothetical protein